MTAAAATITPTPKQIRRQQRQSSPTYSDFVVFNKDAMMNTTNSNTVIDTTPLEDTNEWTSFNHPTDWKVSSSKSIATVKTADDDDEWTLFDDQSTAFNTNMGNDIVDKTTIIMSTTKSSSSSSYVNNDGSTIGDGGGSTTNSTTQRSVTTPSYTEKEYDIDTLVRIKQAAAAQQAQQQQQSKHVRTASSSSLAAASAAASVGCGSKASIQSILRKSSYTADNASSNKSKGSGSVTFDSVKSKTSTFMEELQTTCGQYLCSRSRGTVGINDILTGKCQDLLLTKDERKVDIDYTFLGKVISCATKMNGCVPFDECGGCGSGSLMEEDDEDTAVSTLTEIRWSDDVVKK